MTMRILDLFRSFVRGPIDDRDWMIVERRTPCHQAEYWTLTVGYLDRSDGREIGSLLISKSDAVLSVSAFNHRNLSAMPLERFARELSGRVDLSYWDGEGDSEITELLEKVSSINPDFSTL